MAISYIGDSGLFTGTDDYVTIDYPAGLSAGDIAIAAIGQSDDDSWNSKTDWDLLVEDTSDRNVGGVLYGHICDGTETGSTTFYKASTAGSGIYGTMVLFRGCATPIYYEASPTYNDPVYWASGARVDTLYTPEITVGGTTGLDRMIFVLGNVEDEASSQGYAYPPYSTAFSYSSSVGSGFIIKGQYGTALNETITAKAMTLLLYGATDYMDSLAVALIPAAAARRRPVFTT